MRAPRALTETFREPNRDFGILPFWFLNGELDPEEMRFQLAELRDKDMQGVVFHGRYGLEVPYLGETYLERIRLGVAEANRLGLTSWIYDEMNWPSGTADKRVLAQHPDLAQRYLECVSLSIRGPWFMCLTGEDSRYLDFERSTPIAMFAIGEDGSVVDLTSNLSFKNVVPWEVPPGEWRLCYIVEKRADYYIDAMDPEATAAFLRIGYDPYLESLGNGSRDAEGRSLVGFYTDEPAMHYFLTAGNNPIVPWTKDMFRRFVDRNGYDLRSRLLHLFFDLGVESARTRHDYYNTTTALYSDAYYKQIHDWCKDHDVLFTGHLLYEEWVRQMVRVEGNLFRHYEHLDIVGVDHLYPVIGTREAPDQHVAIKVASSAAHHFGSERVLCESFGGIFMDATMQRMKWIADWEYVLGVNVLNPHGFHYTFEGPRKRDWPPSMFYQYPWWRYYGEFSAYMSRTSEVLTGGRHVAKVAVLWPINAMFAAYIPHVPTPEGTLIESGLNVLTDVLLRLHHDFDYLDEDVLATATVSEGRLQVGDEDYELVLVPPMEHVRASTVDALERFAEAGGRVLSVLRAPRWSLDGNGLNDVSDRMASLFGPPDDPSQNGALTVKTRERGQGRASFLAGDPGAILAGPGAQRDRLSAVLDEAVRGLIEPDIELDNPEIFVLHRRKDDSDVYFLVNTTFERQTAEVRIPGDTAPRLWDPSSGEMFASNASLGGGNSVFQLELPPVGSLFAVTGSAAAATPPTQDPPRVSAQPSTVLTELSRPWTFSPESDNALVVKSWRAAPEGEGSDPRDYAAPEVDDGAWQEVVAGAWALQLPAEPETPWPIAVWYRIPFDVEVVPDRLSLLVDGFDGDDSRLWLNGEAVSASPVRSDLDAQMKQVDLTDLVRSGHNVLAVRLVVRDRTGGLVDHVKILGSFALDEGAEGPVIVAPAAREAEPRSWTEQGYPNLSGCGTYRTTLHLPEVPGGRLLLEVPMRDDVLEVEVNGARAGVRLWDPYVVDVTGNLRVGDNDITLRVANTPANLLNGVPRPSGLAGAPRLLVDEPVGDERAAEGSTVGA